MCIAVGVVCAHNNTIARIVNFQVVKSSKAGCFIKFVIECILMFLLMILRQGPLMGPLYPLWDALFPVIIAAFCCEFIFIIPGLRQILIFLGIYSANIFLVHNYIRKVWFYDFTYSFKYPLVIITVLFMISLILSILIEQLKKILHYNQFINFLVSKSAQQ